ncbi:MAG: SUMF1/EgtB/PvdO family nonheme iron enzyme [Bacteroidia bacterium]|nr:SUMF1/EgtB/PvdO family nonheme iron enzyme [Bacteroidia bacterium]
MKHAILLFTLILLLSSFYLKPRKKFIPPGTVQITEHFFADETEISNFSWREYERSVANKYGFQSPEHLKTLPDTLVWKNSTAFNEPYVKCYYRHPAYKDYPVVGISYDQAMAFAKWRTETVKEYYAIVYKSELNIEYRLPSKKEWELISNSSGNILSANGTNKKGLPRLNCFRRDDTTCNADIIAPVYSYQSNRFGLFNCLGNVAEMLQEPGISKGGSWIHPIESCRPGKDILYTKPESWLGFRCVCLVKT